MLYILLDFHRYDMLYILLDLHRYVMLYILLDFHRYDMLYILLDFHIYGYAAAHSLGLPHICNALHSLGLPHIRHAIHSLRLPHIRHATLLHILLDFHRHDMLLCCIRCAWLMSYDVITDTASYRRWHPIFSYLWTKSVKYFDAFCICCSSCAVLS